MKSRDVSEEISLNWPIDLGDEQQVVEWIAEVTGSDESSIRDCLRREFEQPGANVARAFAEESLEPYTWSEELVRFYERTDAFLYELVLWNRNSIKRRMRSYIAKYLAEYKGSGQNVLCVGDGLGFDSFYFALNGHKVTYYEVPGFSHRFASKLFSLADADIKIASETEQIRENYFDAVVCLDVLEHIKDVPGFLRQLVDFIHPGGILIAHAPFYMIHPANPTHLKINRKYSGSLALYRDCGQTMSKIANLSVRFWVCFHLNWVVFTCHSDVFQLCHFYGLTRIEQVTTGGSMKSERTSLPNSKTFPLFDYVSFAACNVQS